ncbi:uncharacterized protein F4812DRAFT_466970 [Daldinia caldariorum]|uniref:uncharacterized protein n=1 Tax=Daldinia caldariorum TaxID=326644 RepID=UPI0020078575|nr:uncharacterized protein F4812DRAFT_466970 [Daldinia caldariorum]KAI1464731.1 hypothetical protein F4812DRAFT_466970 [Daldinia caldariorum]
MSLVKDLFSNREHEFETTRWHSRLSKDASCYENCVVKSVIHVKSVASSLAHESLHIAIENTVTGARTRIVAERNVSNDLVVLGRWGSTHHPLGQQDSDGNTKSNGSRSVGSSTIFRPVLPLRSLKFTTDSFTVVRLAEILKQTTVVGGPWCPVGSNCYWFAATVYKSIKKQFSCVEDRYHFYETADKFEQDIKKEWYTF